MRVDTLKRFSAALLAVGILFTASGSVTAADKGAGPMLELPDAFAPAEIGPGGIVRVVANVHCLRTLPHRHFPR